MTEGQRLIVKSGEMRGEDREARPRLRWWGGAQGNKWRFWRQ